MPIQFLMPIGEMLNYLETGESLDINERTEHTRRSRLAYQQLERLNKALTSLKVEDQHLQIQPEAMDKLNTLQEIYISDIKIFPNDKNTSSFITLHNFLDNTALIFDEYEKQQKIIRLLKSLGILQNAIDSNINDWLHDIKRQGYQKDSWIIGTSICHISAAAGNLVTKFTKSLVDKQGQNFGKAIYSIEFDKKTLKPRIYGKDFNNPDILLELKVNTPQAYAAAYAHKVDAIAEKLQDQVPLPPRPKTASEKTCNSILSYKFRILTVVSLITLLVGTALSLTGIFSPFGAILGLIGMSIVMPGAISLAVNAGISFAAGVFASSLYLSIVKLCKNAIQRFHKNQRKPIHPLKDAYVKGLVRQAEQDIIDKQITHKTANAPAYQLAGIKEANSDLIDLDRSLQLFNRARKNTLTNKASNLKSKLASNEVSEFFSRRRHQGLLQPVSAVTQANISSSEPASQIISSRFTPAVR